MDASPRTFLPALGLALGGTGLLQYHAAQWWMAHLDPVSGPVWPLATEAAGLWLICQGGFWGRATGLLAMLVVVAGPLHQVAEPLATGSVPGAAAWWWPWVGFALQTTGFLIVALAIVRSVTFLARMETAPTPGTETEPRMETPPETHGTAVPETVPGVSQPGEHPQGTARNREQAAAPEQEQAGELEQARGQGTVPAGAGRDPTGAAVPPAVPALQQAITARMAREGRTVSAFARAHDLSRKNLSLFLNHGVRNRAGDQGAPPSFLARVEALVEMETETAGEACA